MTGPSLLPGRTDTACFLIADNAHDGADRVQLSPEPEAFRRKTLDLTLLPVDLLLGLGGRYFPALDIASFGDRHFDELLDTALPGPQLADPIRQGLEMSCARPGGKAAASGMIVGAHHRDGRHERWYPGLAPLPCVRSTASLIEPGPRLVKAAPGLR